MNVREITILYVSKGKTKSRLKKQATNSGFLILIFFQPNVDFSNYDYSVKSINLSLEYQRF